MFVKDFCRASLFHYDVLCLISQLFFHGSYRFVYETHTSSMDEAPLVWECRNNRTEAGTRLFLNFSNQIGSQIYLLVDPKETVEKKWWIINAEIIAEIIIFVPLAGVGSSSHNRARRWAFFAAASVPLRPHNFMSRFTTSWNFFFGFFSTFRPLSSSLVPFPLGIYCYTSVIIYVQTESIILIQQSKIMQ